MRPARSSSGATPAGTSSRMPGFCTRPFASVARAPAACGSSAALPGAKVDELRLLRALEERPRNLKGAVTTLTIRFLMICQTIGPMRNLGSSSDPVTGTSRSITPSLSLSSQVANLTGRVASPLLARGRPPLELLDADLVRGIELAVLDQVMEIGVELALGDAVAREFARVGVEDRQRDVLELQSRCRCSDRTGTAAVRR